MKIVYYFNQEKSVLPVKDFLFKYDIKRNDSERTVNHKIKVLAFIDQAIKFTAENNGKPIPPIAKTIRGYKFHELRVKDGSSLIRIFYFVYIQKKLVLLNCLEKSENYDKGLKKKINKEIKKAIELTNQYYKDFIINQTYEKYK
jgi:phage-related protein